MAKKMRWAALEKQTFSLSCIIYVLSFVKKIFKILTGSLYYDSHYRNEHAIETKFCFRRKKLLRKLRKNERKFEAESYGLNMSALLFAQYLFNEILIGSFN